VTNAVSTVTWKMGWLRFLLLPTRRISILDRWHCESVASIRVLSIA
jgi:hypothetical protein